MHYGVTDLDTLAPMAPIAGVPADMVEKLRAGLHSARGTMAPETVRALDRGGRAFADWCRRHKAVSLPALPETVAAYVDELAAAPARKAAGIRQAVWAVAARHRLAGQPDPTKAEVVRNALKRMSRRPEGTAQRQAAPVRSYEVRRVIETAGARLIDKRNVALLLVMRDMLARRSEVVALNVADVTIDPDGSATARVRRSKTDQAGQGVDLFLSRQTIDHLRQWLMAAQIEAGPIFRAVNKVGALGERMQAAEVSRVVKRLAAAAGLPAATVAAMSGHSARVGMAQDLVANGADLAGVMQAGRWKSAQMPARYSSRLLAKDGAVARLYLDGKA